MTREELRQYILDGDKRLSNSIAWRFLTDEDKRVLQAGMAFWEEDTPTTNTALDRMVELLS